MQDENHKVVLREQRPEPLCSVKLKITQPWNYVVLNAASESSREAAFLQACALLRRISEDLRRLLIWQQG